MRDCFAWISDLKEDSVSESRVVIAVIEVSGFRAKRDEQTYMLQVLDYSQQLC